MSKNLKLKRVALVAISAMGLGVFSVMPAKAASFTTVTLGNLNGGAAATVAARSPVAVTFSVTTDAAASGDAIVYSLAVTTRPAASALAVANPGTGDASAATVAFKTGVGGTEEAVAGWALTTVGATRKDSSTGTTAIAGKLRGVISVTPDAVGTYVITLSAVATPNGGEALATLTKTFTVNATAVNNTNLKASSINLKRYTSSPTVDSAIEVNFGLTMTAGVTPVLGDGMSLTAYLSSYPSGGFQQVTASTTCSDGATAATYPTALGGEASATGSTLTLGATAVATNATAITASTTACTGSLNFTPNKTGDFTLTVWNDTNVDGTIGLTEARQTLSVTVKAAAGYSAPLSTVYIGAGTTQATAATDLLAVTAIKTVTTKAANIRVALKNTLGAAYGNQTVTASISGPGLLSPGQSDGAAGDGNTTAGSVRATSVKATAGFASFVVDSDGTSGTGTVTISVTDQVSGATSVLGTKSITFYGSVAKLEISTSYYTILKAGGGVTGGSTAAVAASGYLDLENRINATDIPAAIIKATDSSGNPVGGLTILGLSSDVTVANSWTGAGADAAAGCKEDVKSAANVYSSGGTGYYNCALSTPSSAVSGGTATITFRVLDPADPLGVAYLTVTQAITVGKTSVATETLSLDKDSYASGEAMVITRTAVDSAGNPVADGTAAPAVSFNKAVGGTAPAGSTYVGGKRVTSATAPSVFAPVISGPFIARMTSGNTAATVVTATATVVGDSATVDAANAASDAASEAIDAANAATDAANLAAEAADAATVAAEEARDSADAATAAVEALATEVATLMAALKAQITTLANVVAKIAKRTKS